jgi:hypothetical protein
VPLDERGLAGAAVADEDELEAGVLHGLGAGESLRWVGNENRNPSVNLERPTRSASASKFESKKQEGNLRNPRTIGIETSGASRRQYRKRGARSRVGGLAG